MIPTMLVLGLVLGVARARWWGTLIAGVVFVVQVALATDNAPATWISSYALAVLNAGAGWLVGTGVALGIAAAFRRARGDRAGRADQGVPGDADGPPPRGRAA